MTDNRRPQRAAESQAHQRVAAALLAELGAERYQRSFAGRATFELDSGVLTVRAASRGACEQFRRRFEGTLERVASRLLVRDADSSEHAPVADGSRVRFTVETPEPGVLDPAHQHATAPVREGADAAASDSASRPRAGAAALVRAARPAGGREARTAENRYRLEDFIVGESNRLAYNAAAKMAEGDVGQAGTGPAGHAGYAATRWSGQTGPAPASSGRLLFLHGPCGLGKTHLLHGLALRFRERNPGAVIRITDGESFMNEFVGAIRSAGAGPSNGSGGSVSGGAGVMERFRRVYRNVDLLCIDDVHFLAAKQATQSELLHTFDDVERCGARVVLASDTHPRLMQRFSPALVSRFMAGLVAGVSAPDTALCEKIVRSLALRRGLVIDEAASRAIAERAQLLPPGSAALSVRDLEGLLTRVEAVHRLLPEVDARAGAVGNHPGGETSGRVTTACVERALGTPAASSVGARPVRPVRIDQIIAASCSMMDVTPSDLAGRTRHKRVVLARAIITHLARTLTTQSFPDIARALGRPSHSTVITAFQRFQQQLARDERVELETLGQVTTVGALTRQLTATVVQSAGRTV